MCINSFIPLLEYVFVVLKQSYANLLLTVIQWSVNRLLEFLFLETSCPIDNLNLHLFYNVSSLASERILAQLRQQHPSLTAVNTNVTTSTTDRNDMPTKSPSQDPTSDEKIRH